MIDTKTESEPMHLVLNEEDLPYEEEILRNPHSIKPWIRYIEHKADAPKNMLNLVFDRALRALPPTQHDRVWPLYIKFVTQHNIPETAVRVFRRHLQMFPDNSEQFIDYLVSVDKLDDASQVLAKCVNNPDFVSKSGKSNHQMWNELCEMISKNPTKIKTLNVVGAMILFTMTMTRIRSGTRV